MRILGTGIALCVQDLGLAKTGSPKFGEEGTAFFSAGNSGKPIGFAGLFLRRQWSTQDKFCPVNGTLGSHDTG